MKHRDAAGADVNGLAAEGHGLRENADVTKDSKRIAGLGGAGDGVVPSLGDIPVVGRTFKGVEAKPAFDRELPKSEEVTDKGEKQVLSFGYNGKVTSEVIELEKNKEVTGAAVDARQEAG